MALGASLCRPVVKIGIENWKELGRFEGHADDTNALALMPAPPGHAGGGRGGEGDVEGPAGAAGGFILSGSDDHTVKVWRAGLSAAGDGSCVTTLAGHDARVWAVTADERHIYSCSADRTIAAWSAHDAAQGAATLVARMRAHSDVVYAVRLAFGALFSSSADRYGGGQSCSVARRGRRGRLTTAGTLSIGPSNGTRRRPTR